jgi:serine/threonine protein kinase
MKPLSPNTLLQNRYLVVHLIGKGGMGEVYLAVDQRLGSAIALKRTFFSDDESLGNAFEREARTLARLRHPVLPKVSDHFSENENQYLVMDHISGDDLSKRLEATQKPFPLSWVLFWADQLLDALSYLHAHEPPIIHRDIKPQNLKLTDENNIVLLDFGLSKNSLGETRITSSGSVGFTPNYAPMEQIRGTGTNPRSDIYSLSATLYQLLTNQVPPDALSRADSLLNDAPDPIDPPANINAEVTQHISDVILKGMSISQEQRFGTAREMQKELRDAYAKLQKAESEPSPIAAAAAKFIPEPVDPQGVTERMAPASESKPKLQSKVETQIMPVDEGETSAELPEKEDDFDRTIAFDPQATEFGADQSGFETVIDNDFSAKSEATEEEKVVIDEAPVAPVAAASEPQFDEVETIIRPSDPGKNDDAAVAAVPVATESAAPQPQASVAPEKKKSKALAVVVGLLALFILVAGAAAVGWYFYNDRSFFPASGTPTPTPAISKTPTPAETVSETNTSSEDVNANTEILTNTPKTDEQNSTKPSPKKSDIPKQTPKSTPKKNSRTDILQ